MNLLPKGFLPLILTFGPPFSKPVWESAIVLLVGAILAPGKRTVSAILRVMELDHEHHFQKYTGCSIVLCGQAVRPVSFYYSSLLGLCTKRGVGDGH